MKRIKKTETTVWVVIHDTDENAVAACDTEDTAFEVAIDVMNDYVDSLTAEDRKDENVVDMLAHIAAGEMYEAFEAYYLATGYNCNLWIHEQTLLTTRDGLTAMAEAIAGGEGS